MEKKLIVRNFKKVDAVNHEGNTITISQFNMLADLLSDGGFKDVPKELLCWDYRKDLVFQQIECLKSDIICIEENDKYEEISQHFGSIYDSVYLRKEGEFNGKKRDGTSVFFFKGEI